MNLETKELRKSVIKEIEERVNLGITEKATADFLKKYNATKLFADFQKQHWFITNNGDFSGTAPLKVIPFP